MLLFSDPANPEADGEPLSLSLGPGGGWVVAVAE